MNKKMIWLSAFALSMSLSQVSFACGCHGGELPDYKHHEKMIDKLDLTSEQSAKIKRIRAHAKDEIMPKLNEMRDNRRMLNELANEPTLNEDKVANIIEKQEKIGGEIAKIRVHARHEVSMVLNEKQKAKIQEMRMKWEKKHHMEKGE